MSVGVHIGGMSFRDDDGFFLGRMKVLVVDLRMFVDVRSTRFWKLEAYRRMVHAELYQITCIKLNTNHIDSFRKSSIKENRTNR